jgi:hypothetical protein
MACPVGFGGGGTCPVGFGAAGGKEEDQHSSLPEMPLMVLKGHGSHGLVSIKGVIYNVMEGLKSEPGAAQLKLLLGHDASRFLACGGQKEEMLDRVGRSPMTGMTDCR